MSQDQTLAAHPQNLRMPIREQLSQLEKERSSLVHEKTQLEIKLRQIEERRRGEHVRRVKRERPGSPDIHSSCLTEEQARSQREPVIEAIADVESRIAENKKRVVDCRQKLRRAASKNPPRQELAPILERIDTRLVEIIELLKESRRE